MKQKADQQTTSGNECVPGRMGQKSGEHEPPARTILLTETLHLAQRKFGDLLHQVCEMGGFTPEKLSREALAELEYMREEGSIPSHAPVGPLGPFTLCRIMAGTQAPSYYQVFLCITALGKHLQSQRFAEICQAVDLAIPGIGEKWRQWEQDLWHLAGFLSPAELCTVYEQKKDLQLIEIYAPQREGQQAAEEQHT